MMIATSKLHILILVQVTVIFIQGYRDAKQQDLRQYF